MLQNCTYLGEIVHKEQSHPGEHTPIVDQPLWDAVHSQLADNSRAQLRHTNSPAEPARRPTVRSRRQPDDADPRRQERHALPLLCLPPADHQGSSERSAGLRIPAVEIEQLVTSRMRQWLLDPASIYQATRFSDASAQRRLLARAAEIGKICPVARSTPACLLYRPDRAHRRRSRPIDIALARRSLARSSTAPQHHP